MTVKPKPPENLQVLSQRAAAIAGQSLATLAGVAGVALPQHLKHGKGFAGQLIEWHLGADGGNAARPDFSALGIELKTVPVIDNKPTESTYVSTVPLIYTGFLTWEASVVYQKLRHVLWVPITADKSLSLGERRVGTPILWRWDAASEAVLQADWEEIMEYIALGQCDKLSARLGTYLHVRPKAANAAARTGTFDGEGAPCQTNPRGFYLRAAFTARILSTSAKRGLCLD